MGGRFGQADTLPEIPMLGRYMRYRREGLGLTQEEVARRMYVSLSLYRKLEKGERPLSMSRLEDWCAAVNAPIWMLQKMVSIALPMLSASIAKGSWPPALKDEDLEHLEAFPFPAFFHRVPEYDVLAANAAAREAFSWLLPADQGAVRPTNVIEQMMTAPEAPRVLDNWYEIVHRLLFYMRVAAPGIVPPERIAQILETCRGNPHFEAMWSTDMTEEVFNSARVVVNVPDSGEQLFFTMRSYNAVHPDDTGYQLFVLTPRSA